MTSDRTIPSFRSITSLTFSQLTSGFSNFSSSSSSSSFSFPSIYSFDCAFKNFTFYFSTTTFYSFFLNILFDGRNIWVSRKKKERKLRRRNFSIVFLLLFFSLRFFYYIENEERDWAIAFFFVTPLALPI